MTFVGVLLRPVAIRFCPGRRTHDPACRNNYNASEPALGSCLPLLRRSAASPTGYTYSSRQPRCSDAWQAGTGLSSSAAWMALWAFAGSTGRRAVPHRCPARVGDGDAGEEIYRQIGGVASVQTLVFTTAKHPATKMFANLRCRRHLHRAVPANYVRFWKARLPAALTTTYRGPPIGGTSAGSRYLGRRLRAMDGGAWIR